MRRTPKPSSLTTSVAVLLSFVLTFEGCSVVITTKERIGPDPDKSYDKGESRATVEQALGEPIATETLADGSERAAYQYTARVNTSSWVSADGIPAQALVPLELSSLFLIELVFRPIAYGTKTKHTYQKEYVYGPDGTIVETSPERTVARVGS